MQNYDLLESLPTLSCPHKAPNCCHLPFSEFHRSVLIHLTLTSHVFSLSLDHDLSQLPGDSTYDPALTVKLLRMCLSFRHDWKTKEFRDQLEIYLIEPGLKHFFRSRLRPGCVLSTLMMNLSFWDEWYLFISMHCILEHSVLDCCRLYCPCALSGKIYRVDSSSKRSKSSA